MDYLSLEAQDPETEGGRLYRSFKAHLGLAEKHVNLPLHMEKIYCH